MSLYGLRQAGRTWHATLNKSLRKFDAAFTNADPCVYQLGKDEDLVLIAIYVDDIILAWRNVPMIEKPKRNLAREFEVKSLGGKLLFGNRVLTIRRYHRYALVELCESHPRSLQNGRVERSENSDGCKRQARETRQGFHTRNVGHAI